MNKLSLKIHCFYYNLKWKLTINDRTGKIHPDCKACGPIYSASNCLACQKGKR